MDSRASAWITAPASAGDSVIRSAPDAMVPRGSRPNASQSARPSGSTMIRSRSMRRPTPAARRDELVLVDLAQHRAGDDRAVEPMRDLGMAADERDLELVARGVEIGEEGLDRRMAGAAGR